MSTKTFKYEVLFRNEFGCDLGIEYCDTKEQILEYMIQMLNVIENGDQLVFTVNGEEND